MESQLNSILAGISHRSTDSIAGAGRFARLHNCSPKQVDALLQAFDIYVISERWLPKHFSPWDLESLALCRDAIKANMDIAQYMIDNKPSPPQEIVDLLISFWPTIFKWLRYFVQVAEDIDTDIVERAEWKHQTLRQIMLYAGVPVLRPAISNFPAIVPLVARLCALELTKSRLYDLKHSSLYVINSCFKVLDAVEAKTLERLLSRESGPQSVAAIALAHLKRSISSRRFRRSLSFEDSISFIIHLSRLNSFGRALLSQGSIAAVIKAGTKYMSSDTPTGTDMKTGIDQCFAHLRKTFSTGNGTTFVVQALKAQILPLLLLGCERSDSSVDDAIVIITSILPQYLIYESVLREAIRAVRKMPELAERWSSVDLHDFQPKSDIDIFLAFRALVELEISQGPARSTVCDYENSTADPLTAMEGLKRCSGCLNAFYCSREHQVADWRIGHRKYCQEVQSMPQGFCRTISPRDMKYIQATIRSQIPKITEQSQNSYDTSRGQSTLIQVSFAYAVPPGSQSNIIGERFRVNCPPLERLPDCMSVDEDANKRWAQLLATQKGVRDDDKVLICVEVLMGRRSKFLMGVTDISDMSSLCLS